MQRYKFYIDNTEIEEPANWSEFQVTLVHDIEDNVRYFQYSTDFQVVQSGYDTLYAKVENNAITESLDFRIEYSTDGLTYNTFLEGFILMEDVEFKVKQRIASFTIIDTSYASSIRVGFDNIVDITEDTSQEGTAITPPSNLSTKGYTTIDGLADAKDRLKGFYLWDEVVDHILAYLTDNNITLDHDIFTQISGFVSNDDFIIFTNEGQNKMPVSFLVTMNDLLKTVQRLFNVGATIIRTGGSYVFRLDDNSNFYSSTTAFTLSDFTDFNLSINTFFNYGRVQLGINQDNRAIYTDEVLELASNPYNFTKESVEVNITGYKNENKALDLRSFMAYTPNSLTNLKVGGLGFWHIEKTSATNIDVEDNNSPNIVASAFDNSAGEFNPSTTVFGQFEVEDILSRYDFMGDIKSPSNTDYDLYIRINGSGGIPFGDGTYTIKFNTSAGSTVDPNGIYQSSTGSFYFNGVNSGAYSYLCTWSFAIQQAIPTGSGTLTYDYYMVVTRDEVEYDYFLDGGTVPANGVRTKSGSFSFTMISPEDAVRFEVRYTNADSASMVGSIGMTEYYVQFDQIDTKRTLRSANLTDVKCYNIDFESNCSITDFATLQDDMRKRIALDIFDENTKYAWVKDVAYTPASGRLEGTLITDNTNLNP